MKPVFIIGAGRSGTTMLYKLLCLNPYFAWISNYMAKYPSINALSALNRINSKHPSLSVRSWFSKESNAFYSNRNLLQKILPTPVEGEAIYANGGFKPFPQAGHRMENDVKKRAIALFQKIAHYQGKQYFLSKRTANNRRIEQLLECFPDAKFVNIIRDGRAVALSLTKVYWWDNHKIWWKEQKTPAELVQENYNNLELAATNWVEEINCIEAGIQHIAPDNLISFKYEDFSANPLKYLVKCAEHVGIDVDKDWLNAVKKVKIYNSNRLWEQQLSEKDKANIMDIQAEKLQYLGYA